MFPQLALLPPLDHKEAIGTLGYLSYSFKTGGQVRVRTFECPQTNKQTDTGLYYIDVNMYLNTIYLKFYLRTVGSKLLGLP